MTQNNNNLPPVLPGHLPPLPEGTTYGGLLRDYDGEIKGHTYDEEINKWTGLWAWQGMKNFTSEESALWHIAIPIARANGIGGEAQSPVRRMRHHYGNCSGMDDCRCAEIDAEEEPESPKPEEDYTPDIVLKSAPAMEAVRKHLEGVSPEERQSLLERAIALGKPTPPKPEGETPLTDGEIHYRVGREDGWNEIVRANFARQLESDLAAARAEVEMSKEAIDDLSADFEQAKGYISTLKFDQLTLQTQLHNANLRNERLRAALEPFANGSLDVSQSAVILGYGPTEAALKTARDLLREPALASSGKGEG